MAKSMTLFTIVSSTLFDVGTGFDLLGAEAVGAGGLGLLTEPGNGIPTR